jgi:hypothetical protein
MIELEFDRAIGRADPVFDAVAEEGEAWLAPGFLDLRPIASERSISILLRRGRQRLPRRLAVCSQPA